MSLLDAVDDHWDKAYEAGQITGGSKERVRILEIIEAEADAAGERAVDFQKRAASAGMNPLDGTAQAYRSLHEVALYEQAQYLGLMKKINVEVE